MNYSTTNSSGRSSAALNRHLVCSVGRAPDCRARVRVPDRTNTNDLKITEENMLPCNYICKWLDVRVLSDKDRTLPLKFDCKFTLQKEIHSHHTRNSHLYRLPLCRTNIKQFSVFYQGPKFYNSLSTEIVNSSSSVSFKKALKAFFYNTY